MITQVHITPTTMRRGDDATTTSPPLRYATRLTEGAAGGLKV